MTACKWNGRGLPRTLLGRHGDECSGEECPGCLTCPEPHCCVCRRAHADVTCAECVGATRDDLHEIAALGGALPTETLHKGVESEAAMLWGPSADPEAWRNRAMSAMVGRLDDAYLEDARDEAHPLWVLGTWEQLWRDHMDQPTDLRATLPRLVDYLNRQMHVMAEDAEVPFEDFARDLRQCRAHLEAVLHDGEQKDTGAPCMSCGVPLERVWGKEEQADGWRCPRCKQRSTEDQYRFAVAHLHRSEATHLTDRDMELRTGIKAGTIRAWAKRDHVETKRDSGRTLYAVADVEKRMRGDVA
jgi:hypothetical protein